MDMSVTELQASSWKDFNELVQELLSPDNGSDYWIFRGVTRSDHKLIPRIGRQGTRKDPKDGSKLNYSLEDEKRGLASYKKAARPYMHFDPRDDLEWLATAQHFGMPTRLLDWTESPLIAAYFALEKSGTEDKPPVVYCLKAPPEVESGGEEFPFPGIEDVRTYYPPHVTPRIQVQRSVFTVHPLPDQEYAPDGLIKWVFPKGCPSFVMKHILDTCGVNAGSLFPDLQNLSEHLRWRHKWGKWP